MAAYCAHIPLKGKPIKSAEIVLPYVPAAQA